MLTDKQINCYLTYLEGQVLKQDKKNIELSQKWVELFPSKPGVYVILENDKPIYVGETGNIRGRMRDLLDSRHHTFRRSVGRLEFSKENSYKNADSKRKFPTHIECLVTGLIKKKFKICYLPLVLGRKELEERIIERHKPKYIQRGKRISN